jgi:hypothetical protein
MKILKTIFAAIVIILSILITYHSIFYSLVEDYYEEIFLVSNLLIPLTGFLSVIYGASISFNETLEKLGESKFILGFQFFTIIWMFISIEFHPGYYADYHGNAGQYYFDFTKVVMNNLEGIIEGKGVTQELDLFLTIMYAFIPLLISSIFLYLIQSLSIRKSN